ncbi:MAG TPA: MmcQ/YjbR family DNA-binding protein [Acidimicrobiales bacterium]
MARKGVAERLRRFALSLPEAYEDFPWGETVVKVNKKVFAFLGTGDRFTVKLHDSHPQALAVPGAVPAGYGLGRAGWVTISLAEDTPPAGVLCDWIEESYRIVAPKRLSAGLDAP